MAGSQDKASFVATLDTSEMTSASNSGASALEGLRDAIAEDTSELANMQKALRNLKGSSTVSAASIKQLSDRITAQKSAIANAQAKYIQLGGSFKKTSSDGKGLSSSLGALIARAKAANGPLGALAGKLEGMGKYAIAAGGVVALAAALVVLATALVGATVALAGYAVQQANAHRNELLTLEALTKTRNYWGVAAGNAVQMQQALNKVASSSALSRSELLGLEQGLYRANLRGQNLTDALEGLALVQQTQGPAAAAFFQSQVTGANMAGIAVKRFTDDAKARLGGIAARQMLDLNVQSAKLHENFAVLFQDLKVEGLLKALQGVTELFSQSSESGKALKVIAETLFQPLIDGATSGGPIVRRFFQGMILQTLNIIIAVQKARLWFRQTFGPSTFGGINGMTTALTAGKVVIWGITAALITLAATVGITVAALGAIGAAVIGPLVIIKRAFGAAWDYIKGLDFKAIGTAVATGLANGITGGVFLVVKAVKGLGGAALAALKQAFDSHSPSRKAAIVGITIPQGLTVGQKRGTPAAVTATRDMGEAVMKPIRALGGGSNEDGGSPARSAARPAGNGAAGSSKPSITVNIDKLICQGGTPAEQATSVKEQLIEELTKIGIAFGAHLEPAT